MKLNNNNYKLYLKLDGDFMGFFDKIFGKKETIKMSDAEIKSYFQDNIIEDEKEARSILKNVKNQQLLTDIVMSWSGYRKNNLIIIDYITDEECLSNIYVNCADPECCKKANEKRRG